MEEYIYMYYIKRKK